MGGRKMNMRRLSKFLFLYLLFLVFWLLPAQSGMAASKYPGNVKNLTLKKQSDTSVKLTWTKASNATGYRVYIINSTTGKKKSVGTTRGTSCVVNKMEVGREYVFQVYAYRRSGKKVYWSKKGSPMARIKTTLSKPGTIKNFRLVCYGNNSVFLAWNEAKNTDYYIVYQYNWDTRTYEKIGSTKENNYQVKKLKEGEKYYFKVQGYHTASGQEKYGKLSDKVGARAKNVDVSAVHGRYWSATVKKNIKATNTTTGKKVTLKKGTKLTTTKKSNDSVTAILKNGKKVELKGSNLSYGNLSVTKSNYTKAQQEAFVNGKGYSSQTDYLIWVNQYTCTTCIFKGSKGAWKLVRSMICVVGKDGHSPVGIFKLHHRVTGYGRPKIFYTWSDKYMEGNSFHSRVDSTTRGAASGGCVRLGDSDLYYLANNCPMGTTVVSY